MDNITGKLGDVGKVVSLSRGPWRRRTEKGLGERLMICEQGKFAGFKGESKMANGEVSCKEFMIKGEDLDLAEDNFLEKKPGVTRSHVSVAAGQHQRENQTRPQPRTQLRQGQGESTLELRRGEVWWRRRRSLT